MVRSASRTGRLYPQECSWYSFSLGAASTPGPWDGQKEYVTEKSSDTTGNRSQDRLTSSAAPQPLCHPRSQIPLNRQVKTKMAITLHYITLQVSMACRRVTSQFKASGSAKNTALTVYGMWGNMDLISPNKTKCVRTLRFYITWGTDVKWVPWQKMVKINFGWLTCGPVTIPLLWHVGWRETFQRSATGVTSHKRLPSVIL